MSRPNTAFVWAARKVGTYPNAYVEVFREDEIVIWSSHENEKMTGLVFDRKLARLLARRINQCLDETRKP